jgi:hypothetical protein
MRKPGSCTPGCGSNISAKWCGKNSSSVGAPGLLKVQRQNKDARIIRFTLCGAAGCVRGAGQQGCILSHSPSSSFAGAWQPGVSGGRKWLCDVGACCVRSGWHYTPPDQRSNAPSVQQKHLTECSEHAHVGRAPALNSAGNLTCTTATLILNAAQREAILAACIVLMFVPAAQ